MHGEFNMEVVMMSPLYVRAADMLVLPESFPGSGLV